MPHIPYAPHETFIAPARNRAQLWRLLAGMALIVVVYLGILFLFGLFLASRYNSAIADEIFAQMELAGTPGAAFLLLYSFLALAVGPIMAVRIFHRRSATTLFGPTITKAIRDFRRVATPLFCINLLFVALVLFSEDVRPGLALGPFLLYLPFALIGILIQVGAEELVFRGYLQQQLAARFRYSAIWMGVPALLFSLGHYAPGQFGANAPLIVLWAFAFACLASDLTARTGSIGAAVAFHMINNLSAFLLIAPTGNFDGLALWTLDIDVSDAEAFRMALLTDLAGIVVSWLVARFWLRV